MATNFVKAKFQEIYDFGTVSGRTTILGIHTPQGWRVQKLLGGFFRQFRKVKYSGCTVSMVPAAQLPADPLQVSFEAGGLTVDPRDLLNPILFHGCHGESMNEILNQYLVGQTYDHYSPTSTDADKSSVNEYRPLTSVAEQAYYAALSDPSFRKYGIQSGAKVGLKPMVHPLVMTNPVVPSTSQTNLYMQSGGNKTYNTIQGTKTGLADDVDSGRPTNVAGFTTIGGTVPLIQGEGLVFNTVYGYQPMMFSNGLRPLGWLPTTSVPPIAEDGQQAYDPDQANPTTNWQIWNTKIGPTLLPKLFMGMFILPPSYTQEMYFRLIINHYFEFKDFTTCLAINDEVTTINGPAGAYAETIPEPTASGSKTSSTSLEVVNGTVELTADGVY